jgi:hypothetical protein
MQLNYYLVLGLLGGGEGLTGFLVGLGLTIVCFIITGFLLLCFFSLIIAPFDYSQDKM